MTKYFRRIQPASIALDNLVGGVNVVKEIGRDVLACIEAT